MKYWYLNTCAFFWHFSAKAVNFVHIFSCGHGFKKLSSRTPPQISRRIFWCSKKIFGLIFYRKFYRKWTGNNDNQLFQSRFQTKCNIHSMLLRVCSNSNLCDVSHGTKVPEKSSGIEQKKSATVNCLHLRFEINPLVQMLPASITNSVWTALSGSQ